MVKQRVLFSVLFAGLVSFQANANSEGKCPLRGAATVVATGAAVLTTIQLIKDWRNLGFTQARKNIIDFGSQEEKSTTKDADGKDVEKVTGVTRTATLFGTTQFNLSYPKGPLKEKFAGAQMSVSGIKPGALVVAGAKAAVTGWTAQQAFARRANLPGYSGAAVAMTGLRVKAGSIFQK